MALPSFIRKLIAPVEAKLVLSALSDEMEGIEHGLDNKLRGWIAINIIKPRVVNDILGLENQIKGEIDKGRPPRVIALYLMMNVTRNYMASGEFANWAGIHRGTLSLAKQGKALYGLNAYCLDELTKLGEMTIEQKAAALEATKEEIRNFSQKYARGRFIIYPPCRAP